MTINSLPIPAVITSIRQKVRAFENLAVVIILLAMAALPMAEVIAREIFRSSIPGAIVTVRHLTLWIGFVGAMLAARENRLLSFTGETTWLRDRWGQWTGVIAGIASVGITITLMFASYKLMATERAFPRPVLGPIQVWTTQLVMPVGFGVMAWRLLMRSSDRWSYRLLVLLGVAVLALLGLGLELQGGWAIYAGFGGLLLALLFGAPIFAILGGVAVLLFWNEWGIMAAIPAETYRLVVHPMLPTLPLFTLAGYFFAEGGASRRLVRVFRACVDPKFFDHLSTQTIMG